MDVNKCNHKNLCKLYVVKNDEGVLRVKRMSPNAKLPVRSSSGAAGYDLAASENAVVPAHGKCLVKTGLAVALPPDCYGRIAPRSGLAVKKFIDVGAGVVDSDYRGEIGVILFNFGDEEFKINMGDRIAQFILEKIKTPLIKEIDTLDGTDRGKGAYGSTGINSKTNEDAEKLKDNKSKQLAQSRQIITARQLQKLAKENNPVFLAVVRANDPIPERMSRKEKRYNRRAARLAAAHGMTEGQKRLLNRQTGPNKDFVSVEERERQVLAGVPESHRERLENLIQE